MHPHELVLQKSVWCCFLESIWVSGLFNSFPHVPLAVRAVMLLRCLPGLRLTERRSLISPILSLQIWEKRAAFLVTKSDHNRLSLMLNIII